VSEYEGVIERKVVVLIQAWGLFWRESDVIWKPGNGRKAHLYGRYGTRKPALELGDFWHQRGVYVLHGNHGAYYAGLAIDQPLGKRLQQHTEDEHAGHWDKFSWFGYCEMESHATNEVMWRPKDLHDEGTATVRDVIKDAEALLILVLNTVNRARMQFREGWEWTQVPANDWATWAARIGYVER
jgi:hypothetical protein